MLSWCLGTFITIVEVRVLCNNLHQHIFITLIFTMMYTKTQLGMDQLCCQSILAWIVPWSKDFFSINDTVRGVTLANT